MVGSRALMTTLLCVLLSGIRMKEQDFAREISRYSPGFDAWGSGDARDSLGRYALFTEYERFARLQCFISFYFYFEFII